MAVRWNRIETWLTLFVGGVGAVLLFVGGLWVYMSAMAKPIHPDARNVSAVSLAAPAPKWNAAVEQARHIARADLAEQNLPGMSIAVGIEGEMVWAEGFGWADIDQKTPVTPETRFRLGTMSIPLTSAAIGLLIDQQRVNLDEKIQTYVPEFPEKKWAVTVRHVMGHTAGIASDGGDEGPLFGSHCDRPVEALQAFADRDLGFEPGTQYRYSRYGFIVMSAAIENAAKDPFLTFMRKEVFEPLGMDDTIADTSLEAVAPDRSTSYFPKFASDPRYGPDPMRPLDYSCYAGSSVFLSTARDIVRFVNGLNAGKLLKPETIQLLQTSQRLADGKDTGYGLGWDVENVTFAGKPAVSVGHDGDLLGGIAGTLLTFRDRGLVVVVLSNISYAGTPALALKIADAFAK
jgi:serine beta-lactamase-like protein LACTB, mitochondrial